jgi:hypothetical protein
MSIVRSFACFASALAILTAAPAARAEDPPTFADRSDEEVRDTDRTFGFLLNPLATAMGLFGGEADFVLGRHAVVAVEGSLYRRGASPATALGTGLLVYPLGSALHRLYLEPRIVYARPLSEGLPRVDWKSDALGLGMTAGWQWTWDYGFSLRLGAGAIDLLGGPRAPARGELVALGPELVLDGSFGWVF